MSEIAQKPVTTAYVIRTKVNEVNEVFRQEHVSGSGNAAIFRSVSRGWFLLLEGSYEALHVGFEKPVFEAGDEVEIIVRRAR